VRSTGVQAGVDRPGILLQATSTAQVDVAYGSKWTKAVADLLTLSASPRSPF
jgi:hypothetical protein